MDHLTVAGSFLITIGHGAGPEVMLLVSTTNPDGMATKLTLPDPSDREAKWPIEVFVGLSAMFGTAALPCIITAVESIYPPPSGFYGLTVAMRYPDVPKLDKIGLSTLGIIVDTGSARGQALAGSSGVAQVAQWWEDRQPRPPER
jgi:hypothetical protein